VIGMDYLTELIKFVINNFMFGQGDSLENDTDFFEKGILVSFIEETYSSCHYNSPFLIQT
jgi:hypothetical protein